MDGAHIDYAEFQIFPSENRYDVHLCSGNIVEPFASGLLEELMLHIPEVKKLYSKGTNSSFKLEPPDNLNARAEWFTRSTLTRFLCIVGSLDIMNSVSGIENEISQLEEARRFHISLYTKDHHNFESGAAAASSNINGTAPSVKLAAAESLSSDTSKNELLQALDLRLTALREELTDAFNQAACATCTLKQIIDTANISYHIGAKDLSDSLHKLVELSHSSQMVDFPNEAESLLVSNLTNNRTSQTEGASQILKSSPLGTPVKYGASPAKVAQVERQSSSESGESSESSEEDQPSTERSRTLVRSASPRRSASPMRRVQIGRSGSRRGTALTIKSLGYFPSRERVVANRDTANSSEDEESEQLPKKSESNIRRMSVQDAINLFESKQRDQTAGSQKMRSLLNASVANKSVLRRWSSGMGEKYSEELENHVSDSGQVISNNLASEEVPNCSPEEKQESIFISGDQSPFQTADVDVELDSSEIQISNPNVQPDSNVNQRGESTDKFTASAEWSRQKEAELNQLLMKMMENKPTTGKYRNSIPGNSKSQNAPAKQRGGFYDHYKEKRDEKLRGEAARTRVEKEAQFRAMQQVLDESKAEMASTNANDVCRRQIVNKGGQRLHRNLHQSEISKKESSKPATGKKPSPKTSLPSTRKSWPSVPSPRATGASPAKTPGRTTSAGTTPVRRKPQAAPPVPRSSPRVDRSQPRPKTVKATSDGNSNVKGAKEKQQQTVTKNGKPTKTKVQTTSSDHSSTAKPSFYNKVTKKSSVVPLESKPFLRKGSGMGPGVGTVSPVAAKTKVLSQAKESLVNHEYLVQAEEEVVINTPETVNPHKEMVPESLENDADLELVTQSPSKFVETESSKQIFSAVGDDNLRESAEFTSKTEADDVSISPSAWVEIEEHLDQPIPCNSGTDQIASTIVVPPIGIPSPRVRHSLSQMLLEESSEPDIIEWGNAENPPAIVYQKDAPKGLKRLLKFARKSKGDSNLTGLSSPSTFSEGEDDGEEPKAPGKKNTESLLRKATLHAKNHGPQRTSSSDAYEKKSAANEFSAPQSNLSRYSAQSSHKLQEGNNSVSTTTKATRSFFTLSAFRGNKP